MSNILSRSNRDLLEQFAWSNILLAFDYDGTLAPIVTDPHRAEMRTRTRRLLAELALLYPVCVISGRAQPDVLARLRGVPVQAVIGNHGAEPSKLSARLRPIVRRWLPVLRAELGSLQGIVIEDKQFSVAIHYRRSRAKKAAREAIQTTASLLDGVRIIGGKQVVNFLPQDAPHKGIALGRQRDRFRCDTAIYVGDDDTDEDVFTLDQPGRLLSIRVGRKQSSAAQYHLDSQSAIDSLLHALITMRRDFVRCREGSR